MSDDVAENPQEPEDGEAIEQTPAIREMLRESDQLRRDWPLTRAHIAATARAWEHEVEARMLGKAPAWSVPKRPKPASVLFRKKEATGPATPVDAKPGGKLKGPPVRGQYRGVTRTPTGRYKAQIKLVGNKYPTYIGTYDREDVAARAYDRVAAEAGRPVEALNFPEQYATGLGVAS